MRLARAAAVGMVLAGAGVGSVRTPCDKSHVGEYENVVLWNTFFWIEEDAWMLIEKGTQPST